jgi:hypothetical protein
MVVNATYNKQRGQSLFLNRIGEHLNSRLPDPDLLQKLATHFADMVCVMPSAAEIAKLVQEGHPHFAAVRLADACAQAASSRHVDPEDFQAVVVETIKNYQNAKAFNADQGVREKTAQELALDDALAQQMMSSDVTEEMLVEEEDEYGRAQERMIRVDTFSMTQYMDRSDLSTEGKRAMGALPSDFDPEVDDEESATMYDGDEMEEAIITEGPDGYPQIHCPHCKGTEIFPDGSQNEFGCFNCDDVRFAVKLGLGEFA